MDWETIGKKAENFWYYYKWYVLGGVFLVLTLLIGIHSCKAKPNPDLHLLYIRDETPNAAQTAELEEWMSSMVDDINEDGEKTARILAFSRSNMWNGDDSAALVVQVNSGDAVLYMMSEIAYNTLHENGVLQDLSAFDSPYIQGDRYLLSDAGVLQEMPGFIEEDAKFYLCMRKVEGTSAEGDAHYEAQQALAKTVIQRMIKKEKK
jgi:hypothetical protein